MNQYRLIALDMDGTLLNSELKLTSRTRQALSRAAQAGKRVVLSTGRCLSEIRDIISDIPEIRYMVCENGACVYDRKYDQAIHVEAVPTEQVCQILSLMRGERVVIQVFHENQSYVNQADDSWMDAYRVGVYKETFNRSSVWDVRLFDHFDRHPFQIEKINLYFQSESVRSRVSEMLMGRPLKFAKTIGYMLEAFSEKADKGVGLKKLCDHLQIGIDETIAVGDSLNDIEILRAAGFSAAMGNACPEAKAVADFVTDDCDHDGVVRVIDEILLA